MVVSRPHRRDNIFFYPSHIISTALCDPFVRIKCDVTPSGWLSFRPLHSFAANWIVKSGFYPLISAIGFLFVTIFAASLKSSIIMPCKHYETTVFKINTIMNEVISQIECIPRNFQRRIHQQEDKKKQSIIITIITITLLHAKCNLISSLCCWRTHCCEP